MSHVRLALPTGRSDIVIRRDDVQAVHWVDRTRTHDCVVLFRGGAELVVYTLYCPASPQEKDELFQLVCRQLLPGFSYREPWQE